MILNYYVLTDVLFCTKSEPKSHSENLLLSLDVCTFGLTFLFKIKFCTNYKFSIKAFQTII